MTNQRKALGVLGSGLKPATLRILAASVLITGLSGCGHRHDYDLTQGFVAPVQTVEQRHPIRVETARATLNLATPGNAVGLNVYQKERVRHFIAVWRNEGTGKLSVSGNNQAALADLRDLLIEQVVPVGAVQVVRSDTNQPAVKVSFARYVAEAPPCGKFPNNLARDGDNTEYENFGCADRHNLAAMIANPRDLQKPRDQDDWSDADHNDFQFRQFNYNKPIYPDSTQIDRNANVSEVAKH